MVFVTVVTIHFLGTNWVSYCGYYSFSWDKLGFVTVVTIYSLEINWDLLLWLLFILLIQIGFVTVVTIHFLQTNWFLLLWLKFILLGQIGACYCVYHSFSRDKSGFVTVVTIHSLEINWFVLRRFLWWLIASKWSLFSFHVYSIMRRKVVVPSSIKYHTVHFNEIMFI